MTTRVLSLTRTSKHDIFYILFSFKKTPYEVMPRIVIIVFDWSIERDHKGFDFFFSIFHSFIDSLLFSFFSFFIPCKCICSRVDYIHKSKSERSVYSIDR